MEWLKVYDSTSPQDWEKPCRNMTFEGLQDAYDYIDRRCPKFFSEQKYTSFLVALAAKRLELQKQLTVADAKKKKEKLGTQIDTLNRLFDTFSHKISPGSTKLKKLIVQDDIKFIKKHGTYIKNEEAENVFCNYQMGHINDSEEEVTEKIQSLLRCKEKTGKPVSRKKKKQNGESVSVLPKEDRKSADVEHLLSINSAPKEQVTILENDPFDPNQIPTQFVIHENEEEDPQDLTSGWLLSETIRKFT